jgi:hypothetical protein
LISSGSRRKSRNCTGRPLCFAVHSIDAFSNDEVIAAFRAAREADYTDLLREADKSAAKAGRHPAVSHRIVRLRERLARLDAISFFPPPNRDAAAAAVARLDRLATGSAAARRTPSADRLDRDQFQRRIWLTRPRPGVDRMSSAWLIRRFIDPKARFAFADKPAAKGTTVPFDMYGVEFGHTDRGCTFETIVARFGIADPAVERIAHIVHDLDLKETRYDAPEAPAIAHLVDGLRAAYEQDAALLDHGIVMFEALYRSFHAAEAVRATARRPRRRTRR